MSFVRRLASRSAIIFVMRLAGAGLMFVAQALLARRLGQDSLGHYTQALAAINLVAAMLPLGFQTIASYFAADYGTRQQGALLRGFLKQSFAQTAAASVVVYGVGLVLFSLMAGGTVATYWTQVAVMAAALAVLFVSAATLVALRRPVAGLAGDALGRPLTLCVALLAVLALPAGDAIGRLLWIMALLISAMAAVYALAATRLAQALPVGDAGVRSERGRWWRFALPWTVIAVATDYFFDLDVLLLSPHLSYGDIALFGVVARMFGLAAFGVGAIYAVSLPDIFEAEARRDAAAVQARIARTNLVATAVALCLIPGALLLGPWVLGLFGAGFAAGTVPLAILCLALVARAAFGPAALVLSLHNRPYAPLPSVAVGLATLVVANSVLVPLWGLTGAALAALCAITLWSAAMWLTAWRLTGVDVSVLALLSRAPEVRAPSGAHGP